MAKFRIRLKVQALELEIDGEREDIPALGAAVRQQFAGLVRPAELTLDAKQLSNGASSGEEIEEEAKGKSKSRKRSTGRTEGAAVAIELRPDPTKYGNPVQTWGLAEKAMWILFVIGGVTGTKEVSGPQLAATYNLHFKGAGKLHPPNVSRELTKLKLVNPPPVQEDKGLFFLTDEGDRQMKQLIQGVLQAS